jgi:hypothetical protein
VLDLWNYSRRPRVLYPVAGLPCWSGIHTRWNMRPCPATLNGYFRFYQNGIPGLFLEQLISLPLSSANMDASLFF